MEPRHKSHTFVHSSDQEWEKTGGGVRRKILGFSPEVMMVRVEFVKGALGYVHEHPHRQVTYVEAGLFEVEIDGKKEVLSAGDSFIVVPHALHGVSALEDGSLIDVFTPAREDFLEGKK